jgi:hypothetical protein
MILLNPRLKLKYRKSKIINKKQTYIINCGALIFNGINNAYSLIKAITKVSIKALTKAPFSDLLTILF